LLSEIVEVNASPSTIARCVSFWRSEESKTLEFFLDSILGLTFRVSPDLISVWSDSRGSSDLTLQLLGFGVIIVDSEGKESVLVALVSDDDRDVCGDVCDHFSASFINFSQDFSLVLC